MIEVTDYRPYKPKDPTKESPILAIFIVKIPKWGDCHIYMKHMKGKFGNFIAFVSVETDDIVSGKKSYSPSIFWGSKETNKSFLDQVSIALNEYLKKNSQLNLFPQEPAKSISAAPPF